MVDPSTIFRMLSKDLLIMFIKTSLLVLILCNSCQAQKDCDKKERAFSNSGRTGSPWDYAFSTGVYPKNVKCLVQFEAYDAGDTVKLRFHSVDLPSDCSDKVEVYDGESEYDTLLTTICGKETPTVRSSGRYLLTVFTSDDYDDGSEYKGYRIWYSSIDTDGSDDWDTSINVSSGTIAAIIIVPIVIISAIAAFIFYRRHSTHQKIEQNLAATGHTMLDMRRAMGTMMQRAHPDIHPRAYATGLQHLPPGAYTRHQVILAANQLKYQASRGRVVANSGTLLATLLQHMDESASARINGVEYRGQTQAPEVVRLTPQYPITPHDPSAVALVVGDGPHPPQQQYPTNSHLPTHNNHYQQQPPPGAVAYYPPMGDQKRMPEPVDATAPPSYDEITGGVKL